MGDIHICAILGYAAVPTMLIVAVSVKWWELRKYRHWQPTDGKVIAVGVNWRRKTPGDPGYNFHGTEVSNEPRIDYEYHVAGKTYRGGRLSFDDQQSDYRIAKILAPVPEPSSILGVSAAALGLAGWVRRRHRDSSAARRG